MKYIYEYFTFPPDQSFTVRSELMEENKYTALRCHVNFEIALVENCIGRRYIGDHIKDFEGTELALLGSYVPHCWQFFQALDPMLQAQVTVIHFFPDFMGQQFLEKPEARQLKMLLDKAVKGVLFTGDTTIQARQVMQQMLHESGLSRVTLMLHLLDILAKSNSAQVLSSPYFNGTVSSGETKKLNKVIDHIVCNFKKEIALQDAADLLSMSIGAFCRFFKLKTNRTFIDFLKEVRINNAAKLLLEGNHNVTEACYESGYNNISNFNKQFREVKGLSPRDFLMQYRKNAIVK